MSERDTLQSTMNKSLQIDLKRLQEIKFNKKTHFLPLLQSLPMNKRVTNVTKQLSLIVPQK